MCPPPENWKGKWFQHIGWRVFPKARESEVRALFTVQKDEYHHQVQWSLENLREDDETKARKKAKEFLAAVTHASHYLPLLFEVSAQNLREHSWKHSTYEQIQDLGRRALDEARTIHLNTMKPAARTELLFRAIQKDPEAVAILSHNFPRKSDRVQIAALYLGTDAVIPSVGDLAGEYMDAIYQVPRSPRAVAARRNLKFLMTKRAVGGIPGKSGRMRKSPHPGYLEDAYLLSQGLFRQMREVAELAHSKERGNELRRISFLKRLYPWLKYIRVDQHPDPLPLLFRMTPAVAAYYILGHVVKMSRRKIEQILSESRSATSA
jgi:hypothetical protein